MNKTEAMLLKQGQKVIHEIYGLCEVKASVSSCAKLYLIPKTVEGRLQLQADFNDAEKLNFGELNLGQVSAYDAFSGIDVETVDLLRKVLDMRSWQVKYFKTSDKRALNEAKQKEKQVDETLAELFKDTEPVQTNLFG